MQQVPWLAAERYEVGEVVGRGGYGMVCRGLDRKTGQAVALKMLSPEAGRNPDVVERMLREQQALVALRGTCAVTAIDLCRLESGAPCLVMEWLDGRDLEQQLAEWEAEARRGELEQLLAVVKPLTETLERAHQIGILHRDIKPANIFLLRGGGAGVGVRLLDFGLSRMKSAAPLTEVGMVMGSPSYIAPETWRGNSTLVDGRADWFALGVIVFRWLTGELPFDAPDLIGKMVAVTSGPRPSAVALRPDLPASVDAWVLRALAIEPDNRFQTGDEFHAALAAALRGETWPQSSAEVSGVRAVISPTPPKETSEKKNALATAWGAAAALLKRFTTPREQAVRVPSTPATAPSQAPPAVPVLASADAQLEESPASERKSIWLDSTELEDLSVTEPAAVALVAPPAPASDPPSKAKNKRKAKREAKKTKAERSPKGKAARSKKARSKKRKA